MPVANEGKSIGTLQYIASEQVEGKDADDCTAARSFGAVFYEMITEPLGGSRRRSTRV